MMTRAWAETLYDAYGQQFSIDKIYFESGTGHQHLLIFHNSVFGRVMALDGVVQTTQKDEFIYHEMLTHVPLVAHGRVLRALIIGGGDGGNNFGSINSSSLFRPIIGSILQDETGLSAKYDNRICGSMVTAVLA